MSLSIQEKELNFTYNETFYDVENADRIFQELCRMDFKEIHLKIRGKSFTPSRKCLAFGDAGVVYAFSGACITTQEWTPLLTKLRQDVETFTGFQFNYVLLNYYPDGKSAIGAHKDDEKSLDPEIPIATVSVGACRKMEFLRKNYKTVSVQLKHGSLLLMHKPTNSYWSHRIPQEPEVESPRISLTFRYIVQCSSSKKRPRLDFTENAIDDLLPCGDWMEKYVQSVYHCEKDESSSRHSLGCDAYVYPKIFRNELKVHIRTFQKNDHGTLYPTAEGVVLSPRGWSEFCEKIWQFDCDFIETSFVAANEMLVISENDRMHLQPLSTRVTEDFEAKSNFIKLNSVQLEELKNVLPIISKKVTELVLEDMLPSAIISAVKNQQFPANSPSNGEADAKLHVVKCVENSVKRKLNTMFKCFGCSAGYSNQLGHDCINISFRQKYHRVGEKVLYLIDIAKTAMECVEDARNNLSYFTPEFFQKMTVEDYKSSLFTEEETIY